MSPGPEPTPSLSSVRRDLRRIQRRLNAVLVVVSMLFGLVVIFILLMALGGTITISGS